MTPYFLAKINQMTKVAETLLIKQLTHGNEINSEGRSTADVSKSIQMSPIKKIKQTRKRASNSVSHIDIDASLPQISSKKFGGIKLNPMCQLEISD